MRFIFIRITRLFVYLCLTVKTVDLKHNACFLAVGGPLQQGRRVRAWRVGHQFSLLHGLKELVLAQCLKSIQSIIWHESDNRSNQLAAFNILHKKSVMMSCCFISSLENMCLCVLTLADISPSSQKGRKNSSRRPSAASLSLRFWCFRSATPDWLSVPGSRLWLAAWRGLSEWCNFQTGFLGHHSDSDPPWNARSVTTDIYKKIIYRNWWDFS